MLFIRNIYIYIYLRKSKFRHFYGNPITPLIKACCVCVLRVCVCVNMCVIMCVIIFDYVCVCECDWVCVCVSNSRTHTKNIDIESREQV